MKQRLAVLVVLGLLGVSSPAVVGRAWEGDAPPSFADTDESEIKALDRLLAADAWSRRAIAAVRLERYDDDASRVMLERLLVDSDWHVRAFAWRALTARGVRPDPSALAGEGDPRVWRTALRCGVAVEPDRLTPAIDRLGRSGRPSDRLLAVELAAASGDPDLVEDALPRLKKVILRLDRAAAGELGPRLRVVTGAEGITRPHEWQRWLLRTGRGLTLEPGRVVPDEARSAPTTIASLAPERFAALESYIDEMSGRHVDLAIVIDCTGSMHGELAAVQGGLDDLVTFVGDVVASLRVGLVAYRDKRDRFTTKGHDLTADIPAVKALLWSLSADGGGDSREAVYDALRLAVLEMSWKADHTKVMVLVGDAPPHVGFGTKAIELARLGATGGLRTHVIQTARDPVDHFAEIAEAGDGVIVTLEEDERLVTEIAGLSFGDVFARELGEFFELYRRLCR